MRALIVSGHSHSAYFGQGTRSGAMDDAVVDLVVGSIVKFLLAWRPHCSRPEQAN